MDLPVVIVNFKNYERGTGDQAVEMAKMHEKVAQETGANIAVAVNALDLAKVVEAVSIPVFAQHVDPVSYGSQTGKILPEMVKEMGAYGTLINHSENQVSDAHIKDAVKMCKDIGLFTIVCANPPEKGQQIAEDFRPDLVAVEPPDLIGAEVSVATADPKIIERSVELIGENKVLIGAGIKDANDVKVSLALGTCGVLLASGIMVKADDPYAVLCDIVSGLK